MKMIRVNGNYKINALKMILKPAAIAAVQAGSTISGGKIHYTDMCGILWFLIYERSYNDIMYKKQRI